MVIDEKISRIEKFTKEIENEKSFDKVAVMFSEAAALVKQALGESSKERGKVLELIKELDSMVEKEMKVEC